MPWVPFGTPSIQLSIVSGALRRAGVAAGVAHLYVDFLALLRAEGLAPRGVGALERMAALLGDWVFAGSLHPEGALLPADLRDAAATRPELVELVALARRVRELVPAYLDRCVDELLGCGARVVGLSSSYMQTAASLALAQTLKRRAPETVVVLGGSTCAGKIGRALLARYDCVDAIVHGEGEDVAASLFARLVAGASPAGLRGVSFREPAGVHLAATETAPVALGGGGPPTYDDYFERLERTRAAELIPSPTLLVEGSRGCWWAEVSTCTFCAATGGAPRYRRKDPAELVRDLEGLVARHGRRPVCFVDNIMPADAPRTLFPRIRAARLGVPLFVETKANLTRAHLEEMHAAGVFMIQPGIESLSNEVLRLVGKGTSVLQNVRLLKWATELEIRCFWNIVYGFPGEPEGAYDAMAELVPAFVHLQPPNAPIPLRLDRYSRYHEAPAMHGLRVDGPARIFSAVHGNVPELDDLATHFRFTYLDGRRPDEYTERLLAACAEWVRRWATGPVPRLEFVGARREVIDTRGASERQHALDTVAAAVLAAADAGATVAALAARVTASHRCGDEDVERAVRALTSERLLLRDGPRYLWTRPDPVDQLDRTGQTPHAPGKAKIRRPTRPCDLAGRDVRAKVVCLGPESNQRHGDFQASRWSGQGRGNT
jgi:ribosomal peptide maturation radical SAM protein 1